MLFFKDLLEEKFKDQTFVSLYHQECHICSATMEVVARMALCQGARDEILALLDIDPADFESLEAGDHCKPLQVVRLLKHFGMDESAVTERCQRYAGLI